MSELDNAIMEHMREIILEEHRSFSFIDFLPSFDVKGNSYSIDYGTLRNKLSKLRRNGCIELDYRTKQSFYTIKGHKFGKIKTMTSNHVRVSHLSHDPISKLVSSLPFGSKALHDIHLRFKVKGIWDLISTSSALKIEPISKDLRLPALNTKDLQIRLTIHKSDTVSVVVGCSLAPIAVDYSGIIRLSNALTRVEERLSRFAESCDSEQKVEGGRTLNFPEHNSWTVTLWHFGIDSITEYTGEKFCASWEAGQDALIRVYTKGMKEGTRIRLERQECPSKDLANAIEEKFHGKPLVLQNEGIPSSCLQKS